MVRSEQAIASSLWRLTPALPESSSASALYLFAKLGRLLALPAGTPEEVEALLLQWRELEERASKKEAEAEYRERVGGAADQWRQAIPNSLSSPLLSRAFETMRASVSRSASFINVGSAAGPGGDQPAPNPTHMEASGSRSKSDEQPTLDRALLDDDDGLFSTSPPPTPSRLHPPSDAELQALGEMRWVVLARASVGLLRWWLMSLVELSIKAAKSREWWLRQRRRPHRYLLWCGPRVWLRHVGTSLGVGGNAPHEASDSDQLVVCDGGGGGAAAAAAARRGVALLLRTMRPEMPLSPEAVLTSLQAQLLTYAKWIGRLRHCLSVIDHSEDHAALRAALQKTSAALDGVANEFGRPLPPDTPAAQPDGAETDEAATNVSPSGPPSLLAAARSMLLGGGGGSGFTARRPAAAMPFGRTRSTPAPNTGGGGANNLRYWAGEALPESPGRLTARLSAPLVLVNTVEKAAGRGDGGQWEISNPTLEVIPPTDGADGGIASSMANGGGGGGSASGGGGGGVGGGAAYLGGMNGGVHVPPVPLPTDAVRASSDLLAACRHAPSSRDHSAARLAPQLMPSHLERHWAVYTAAAAGTLVGGVALARYPAVSAFLLSSYRALVDSVRSFWREHIWQPGLLIYKELVHRQYLEVGDHQAVQEADQLLRTLLREFKETWGAQLDAAIADEAGGHGGGARGAQRRRGGRRRRRRGDNARRDGGGGGGGRAARARPRLARCRPTAPPTATAATSDGWSSTTRRSKERWRR